jgi:hypothetical protein
MKHSPTPPNSIKIALLSGLIGSCLTVSAAALGNEGFQSPLQRSASVSSFIQVEGFSQAEKTRLRGFLRTAAYGENVPGAMRISANLLDNVASDGRGSTRKAKPKSNDDGECFFQVPERFSIFKATTDRDPCAGLGTLLIADTETQILYLCKNGKSVKDFDFAKGWNGTAKRKEGDERTPLGVYSIKAPQPIFEWDFTSSSTSAIRPLQKKSQGYTGSNVGIHGPSRWARCLGRLNTYVFDWTNGCLAVASDRDIDEVSRFVEENNVDETRCVSARRNR